MAGGVGDQACIACFKLHRPGEEAGGDAPPAAEGLGEAHFRVGGGGDEHEHEQAGVGQGDEHDAEELAIAGEVALFGAESEDGVGDVEGPGEAEADVEKAGDFEGDCVAEEWEKMGGLEVGEEADDAEAEHDEDGVEGDEVGGEGDPDAGFVGLDVTALGGEAEFVDFASGGEGDKGVGEFVAEDVESDGAEAGDEVGEDPSDESEAEEAKLFGLPDAVAGDESPAHFNEGEDGDEGDGGEEEDADPFFEAEGLALSHADGVAGDVEPFAPGAALRAGRGGLASVFFRGQQHGLSLFNFF